MLKYVLLPTVFFIWVFSFYYHFMRSPSTVIAFVGREHVRLFEQMYAHRGVDLWAFGHHPRRSVRIRFEPIGTVFKTFKASRYKQMLVLKKLVQVPMVFETDIVLEYIQNNETVAMLWPALDRLPLTDEGVVEWKQSSLIRIEKISL